MTYTVTIRDAGVKLTQTVEAADIVAAVDLIKKQIRESEETFDGEPRTDWDATIYPASNEASCTMRVEGSRDSTAWLRVDVTPADAEERLIATWSASQDPETDDPIRLRWDAGREATMEDFSRILGHTQSDPYITQREVEFSYAVR